MKKIVLFSLFSLFFLFSFKEKTFSVKENIPLNAPPSASIDYPLPYPGILPDHPLYFLKTIRDKLLLFFTRHEVKKIEFNLLFADKRLVSGELLFSYGKKKLGAETILKGEKYLLQAVSLVSSLEKKNLPPGLVEKIKLSAKKHQETIGRLQSFPSEPDVQALLSQAQSFTHQAISQIEQYK